VTRIPSRLGFLACLAVLMQPSLPGADQEPSAAGRRLVAERCASALIPLRGPACAFADFDGDRKADFAYSTEAVGFGHHLASIAIHLASSDNEQTLDLSVWPAASGLISRDVDRDHDNDLVVTTGLFRRRVAVFLNNGAGAFVLDAQERFLTDPDDDDNPDLVPQTNEPDTPSIEGGGRSAHFGPEDPSGNWLPPIRDRIVFQPPAFARHPSIFQPSPIRAP
jgi:hypothetical protein